MNLLKRVSFLSIVALLLGCSGTKTNEKVRSEWQLQNRGDNTCLYDDNGICKTGLIPSDDSYKWIAETAGEYVRLKNKKTGNYLYVNDVKEVIVVKGSAADDYSSHWQYGGYGWDARKNCSWYNLSNRSFTGNYLTSGNSGSKVKMGETDVNTDLLSHWSFIRIAGSESPFVISSEGVLEASFLGMREAKYISDNEIRSDYHKAGNTWKKSLDISRFPQLKADNHKLLVALYNMALEEMQLDIRQADSTFQAGALWPDTWTRDAVYAIHLAYSFILPDVSKRTLEKQTLSNPKEALQDTGSGGSWPISTDRVVWAIAAWEYYLATGDTDWLNNCYEMLSYTAQKDLHTAFDSKVNLFKGETCSMDWRTHTYPNWYSNATIGSSFSSGTNALHAFLYRFLGEAGKILEKPAGETAGWNSRYEQVKAAINKQFWMPDKGYYSAYMHPETENYYVSPRGGCMSNGLAVVLGIADAEQAKTIASHFPLYSYGAATLYPSIPDDFAYHNKGIWPVWESYLMLGAHRARNIEVTAHIMKSIVRQAALFLTNKENMTYDTGYDRNTALNSDRQLWSVAASLGMIYKIIFGMELTPEGLHFSPAVPADFHSPFELSRFRYRNAELDIVVKGSGNVISALWLDGKKQHLPFTLPVDAEGKHSIEIEVKSGEKHTFHLVEAGSGKCWSPVEPTLSLENGMLVWNQQSEQTYFLWNGSAKQEVTSPYALDTTHFGIYHIYSVDKKGFASDLSNPVMIALVSYHYTPVNFTFSVDIPQGHAGKYLMKIVGANGHGPDGTYCAIRSVFVDGQDAGTFILEATGDWKRQTDSNYLFIDNLSEGKHFIELKFNPENKGFDNNMSRNKENANDLQLDHLELARMSQ